MFATTKRMWWLPLAIMATLGVAVPAYAATVTTKVQALPQYTTTHLVKVAYDESVSAGTVARVDLYESKDGGAYQIVQVQSGAYQPFYVDTTTQGDGVYSFYTVATLDTTETEMKSAAAEATTTVDTVAPQALVASKLSVNQEPSLNANEVIGDVGAVQANSTVQMYANVGLTDLMRSITTKSDGSFGPMDIGGITVNEVWLTVTDAAGNRGLSTHVNNIPSYKGVLQNFSIIANGDTTLLVTFQAPADAKQFRVMYRHAGGAVWSIDYFTVGVNGVNININGLQAGRAYDVRIAPVDANQNVGVYSTTSVRTTGAKVDTVVLPSERVVTKVASTSSTTTSTTPVTTSSTSSSTSSSSSSTTTTKTTKTTDSTAVTTPAANSATSVANTAANTAATVANAANAPAANQPAETQSSATPWVILAILIVLAGIATGGYFYWFSGQEEITTTVSMPSNEKETKIVSDDKEKESDDADKRW